MKSETRIVGAALSLLLAAAAILRAATGVTVWEETFHRPLQGGGDQWTLAARELADGTTLTVIRDGSGLTALQYDHDGNLSSSATFYPVYGVAQAAIDPFGAVFVASLASAGSGYETDLWLMKYDGLTGRGLWPAAVTYGSGDHVDESILGLFPDPAGDLVVEATEQYSTATLLKFSGLTGAPLWGPSTIVTGNSPGAPAALDSAGNVYLAFHTGSGAGSTFGLRKLAAATGATVWKLAEAGHDLEPATIGLDGAGNVVVTGGASAFAGSIEADKYAGATGQKIWGPALYVAPAGNYGTAPDAAAVGADGSVVIFGHTAANSQATAVLLKFRGADGATSWGPFLNTDPTENFYGARLSLAGNGDALLNIQFQTGQSSSDSKTWRYDGGTGSVLWGPQVLVDGSIAAFFVGSNGRLFVGASIFNGTDSDAVILERDGATGLPAWGPTTLAGDAAGYARFWDLTSTPDGNVVVTGNVQAPDGRGSWGTLKYDRQTGGILWGPAYFVSDSYGYSPWQVLSDAAGNVLVAGGAGGGMTIVKYAGDTGAQLWASSGIPGALFGFALDPSGNGIVTGYSFDGVAYDVVTAKISGATGQPLWGPVVYDSGFDDFPDRVASDPAGNVILAGHSSVLQGPPSWLLKYSGSNGALAWGPVTRSDLPSWLAVDAAGNIFEESYGAGITTTKYGGSTGAILWGPFSVGGVGSGYGTALALDASGNVFVTGSLSQPGTSADYAVIKYRGSDGTVLWGPVTYDGGAGRDFPYAIVVDGSGNAVVTGSSETGSNERRSATLSYDGATGALRWGPVGQNIAREAVNGLAASGSTIFVGATRGDVGYLVTALGEGLGIATLSDDVPPASCGHAIDLPVAALNGTAPYSWSITGGTLPPNVTLGSNGHLAGTPSQEGTFSFQVRVQDASAASASRGFTMVVGPGGPIVPILAATDEACQTTLSVDSPYADYDWLPGGQVSPSIVVAPTETTTYGVILDDGSSCRVRGAVTVTPYDPDCVAPIVYGISPSFGPSGGSVFVSGNRFLDGAALSIGGEPATDVVFQSALAIEGHTPSLPPGSVNDVTVINPDGRYGMVLRRFAADFLDVAADNPFYSNIMRVDLAGITAGCGGGNYCPNGSVTRAQMAVFLLKAEHGFFYVPPPCTGVFADVACPAAFAVDWIERLAAEGLTGGCGGGNYCPDAVVTRAQMSAFLLKAEHGASYVPPLCVGVFGDVPCDAPFADWIEQLFNEGITGGCGGGNYCPSSPNTRGQMAVFLTKTFGLP